MKILNPLSGRNPKYLSDYLSYTHKKCTKCNEVKPVGDFSISTTTKNRIGWAYRSYCKECGNRQTAAHAIGNREKRNKRLRDYRKKNPDKVKAYDIKGRIKSLYGITLEIRDEMRIKQNGCCFICGLKKDKLVIDHCHKTGKVRKLLCIGCNTVLGKIEKGELQKFQDYINLHADILLKLANHVH